MDRGRPKFEVTEEVLKKIKSGGAQFLNKMEMAACLGISYETYRVKSKEDPRIEEMMEEGRGLRIASLKKTLALKADNGDNPCLFAILKTYSDLKDKHELDIPGGMNITISARDADTA